MYVLVRSVSVYGPIFSTLLHTFLPHLNAYDDFFKIVLHFWMVHIV